MLNERMLACGKKSSVIREIFEYGKKRKNEIGRDKVFDFSLGNPSVPCPQCVSDELTRLIRELPPEILHGYTSAPGDINVRQSIADYINRTHGVKESADNIFLTVGAAASLTITLNSLVNEGDNVIVFAPFFPEYRVFAEKAGAELRVVECTRGDFQPDLDKLERAIDKKTKAVIINSPNNPTGVIISDKTVKRLCQVLKDKSSQLGTEIFLISDEPYRELVYTESKPIFITSCYANSIVCYSFSKSLSLPGERIGYILVGSECRDVRDVYYAICGSARCLGYVCAPALFQYLIPSVLGKTSDIEVYRKNKDILYSALTEYGYECASPDGAFYLFVKALEDDAISFCERAKKYELLLVPSNDFGIDGYVRISYCVSREQILASLDSFKKLYEEYKK